MNRVDLDSRIPRIVRELPDEMEDVVRRSAERIEDGAKSRAPVDSGDMRDSIRTDRVGPAEYEVIAGAWYSMLVEHGTTKNAARPFLIPAAEADRDNLVKDANAELDNL